MVTNDNNIVSQSHSTMICLEMWIVTCDWLLVPPPPPPPPAPPVPPPAPPLPAPPGCWWLAISAILLSICSKRSRIDILNWLSGRTWGTQKKKKKKTSARTVAFRCLSLPTRRAITSSYAPQSAQSSVRTVAGKITRESTFTQMY